MKAPLYSKEGKKKGEVVLNPQIYGVRVNNRLLSVVRTGYAAGLRRGTADTKERKEVRGGGKKPWKQKGTGRARAGSIRSPLWRGGGTVFGPTPRDYSVHFSKTTRLKAIVSALSLKAGEKNVLLIEDVKLETPKTREWAEIVERLPLQKKRALCVVKDFNENLKRAHRNIRNQIDVKSASEVNAYEILQREKLLIDQEALDVLEARLLPVETKVAS